MRLQTEPDCDALLVFEPTEAIKIASIMTENLKNSTPEVEQSAVKEMGSNMICAFFSAIADFSDLTFVPSEPSIITDSFESIIDVFLAKQAMTAKSALVFQTLFKREHSSANGFFLIIPSPEFQKQLIEAGKKWLNRDEIPLAPQ
jgi:chemotaxis protein CheC